MRQHYYILLFIVFALSCSKKSTPGNISTGNKTLSYEVQVDVHITGTSDVYDDDYHDSVSFRIDVQGIAVTMSEIVNQKPRVTPSSGGSADGTTAVWIPDSIGITNVIGEKIAVAYDSADKKVVNIYFDDSATVSAGWQITDPVLGTYIVASAPSPAFPEVITFVSSDKVQVLKPLDGTGALAQVTYTITPIQ